MTEDDYGHALAILEAQAGDIGWSSGRISQQCFLDAWELIIRNANNSSETKPIAALCTVALGSLTQVFKTPDITGTAAAAAAAAAVDKPADDRSTNNPGSPGSRQPSTLYQLLSEHALTKDVAGVHLTSATLECLARRIEAETFMRCTTCMGTRQRKTITGVGADEGLNHIFKSNDDG